MKVFTRLQSKISTLRTLYAVIADSEYELILIEVKWG